jgi:hypothetical protein
MAITRHKLAKGADWHISRYTTGMIIYTGHSEPSDDDIDECQSLLITLMKN